MSAILSLHRRFIITGALAFFSLGFIAFFKESDQLHPVFQGFIVSSIFFLVIPVLYSKIILKESLESIGWRKGETLAGSITLVACVLLGLTLLILLSRAFPVREQHILPGLVESEFLWFTLYEIVLVSFMALLYEVFFRGLIQFLWLKDFGIWAVIAQAGLLWGLFLVTGSFSWENAPLLLFAPLAGIIAYVSRSIRYSLVGSWLFFFLVDIVMLLER